MIIPDTFLTVHEETVLFLGSCVLGGGLSITWDVVRGLRIAVPHKAAAKAVEDVLFMVLWAASLVCFTSVYAKGVLRLFCVAGTVLGFVSVRLSVGNPVMRLFSRIIAAVYKIIRFITAPGVKIAVYTRKKLTGKFVSNAKNSTKRKNIWSAPLIAWEKMLYNRVNHKKGKGDEKRGRKKQDTESQNRVKEAYSE